MQLAAFTLKATERSAARLSCIQQTAAMDLDLSFCQLARLPAEGALDAQRCYGCEAPALQSSGILAGQPGAAARSGAASAHPKHVGHDQRQPALGKCARSLDGTCRRTSRQQLGAWPSLPRLRSRELDACPERVGADADSAGCTGSHLLQFGHPGRQKLCAVAVGLPIVDEDVDVCFGARRRRVLHSRHCTSTRAAVARGYQSIACALEAALHSKRGAAQLGDQCFCQAQLVAPGLESISIHAREGPPWGRHYFQHHHQCLGFRQEVASSTLGVLCTLCVNSAHRSFKRVLRGRLPEIRSMAGVSWALTGLQSVSHMLGGGGWGCLSERFLHTVLPKRQKPLNRTFCASDLRLEKQSPRWRSTMP